jgi:anti-anti-sigma factor
LPRRLRIPPTLGMLVRYPGQAMENGKILHASHDGIHVLRFVGDIRYTLGHALDHFLESLFAGQMPAGFVIDLTATDCIDSTNLGLLVRIAREMHNHSAPRVTIVSDRPDINAVLGSMALDEVFDIVSRADVPVGGGRELPRREVDRDSLSHTLLKAHRALMELNERNEETFGDVVAKLEQTTPRT